MFIAYIKSLHWPGGFIFNLVIAKNDLELLYLLFSGVVVEAKAQLVGIRDRVRSDVEGSYPSSSVVPPQKGSTAGTVEEGKRVASATNPDAKDAAELLRYAYFF